MKASIQLLEGSSFAGTSGSGHSVTLDVAPEAGGRNPVSYTHLTLPTILLV